ncbi:MAG: SRPBCC family protein [Hyphomicrobiales bacterium]|nr:SRPBCC family protein [Hyphomicrobiales bacterium]MDE2115077.1 SRPBCC family protein [Hyphomicrobiales bacterium]
MKTYTYTTTTHVPAAKLFRAIADIANWPKWDSDLESTQHNGGLEAGARFMLKPKGGPKVKMEIIEAIAPTHFDDLAHLPLAKMRTSHHFAQSAGQTRIDVKIEVWGCLSFFWDRVVARQQAASTPEQTRRFIAYAEAQP